jgi:hypothetical protein
VCIPQTFARQRFGKHFPGATDTHGTIEEMLDALIYIMCVFIKGKYPVISSQNFLLYYCENYSVREYQVISINGYFIT